MSEIAVVTGTTHGIGRVTARELARAGRTVVMLCRDVAAARAVREKIIATVPNARVHAIACDLAALASVREAAEAVRRDFGAIGLLINNAGRVTMRHEMSVDGFELTFATNHLGPFLLTQLLLDRMDAGGRIINVASRVHYHGVLDLAAVVDSAARYSARAVYAQSKLANVLHTFALARRLAGRPVTANCLHPGVVASNLLPRWLRAIKPLLSPVILDEERGARTTLYLALSESVSNTTGAYFDEHQQPQRASGCADDVRLQDALWDISERWVSGDGTRVMPV